MAQYIFFWIGWYGLGLVGSIFWRLWAHTLAHAAESRWEAFYGKTSLSTSRGCFLLMLLGAITGPVCLVLGFGFFFVSWLVWDPWDFWRKPICNCFEPKKRK